MPVGSLVQRHERSSFTATRYSRVWFITGCSSGFGRAFAEAVIAHGDSLIATARNVETLQELVAHAPDRVLATALDVTDEFSISNAVSQSITRFGRIDVLVNNAGFGLTGAIEEVSDDEWQRLFATNVFGLAAVTRAVLPQMRVQRNGHIFNISSIAGVSGSAGLGAYSASKFAVEGLSEALSGEVAPLGIKVTIVEPGGFRTQWAGRSMQQAARQMNAYAQSSGRLRQVWSQFSGRQAGDPARAAAVLIKVAESSQPPLHLALGGDAVAGIQDSLQYRFRDLQTWQRESLSTDFPE